MDLPVYDFHTDIKNLLVTPQIRARFLRMEVGQFNQGHTHDLGQEIFLILQGRAEFVINGKKAVLGPGQLCVALTDEIHTVENVGDEPVIMYLSVTPHIQPTHTYWDEDGQKLPPRFQPNRSYDLAADQTTPTSTLLDDCVAATDVLDAAVKAHTQAQPEMVAAYKAAIAIGDQTAARQTRNAMWDALSAVYQSVAELGDVWNDFAARTVDECA